MGDLERRFVACNTRSVSSTREREDCTVLTSIILDSALLERDRESIDHLSSSIRLGEEQQVVEEEAVELASTLGLVELTFSKDLARAQSTSRSGQLETLWMTESVTVGRGRGRGRTALTPANSRLSESMTSFS